MAREARHFIIDEAFVVFWWILNGIIEPHA